jgi:hypothetical protein
MKWLFTPRDTDKEAPLWTIFHAAIIPIFIAIITIAITSQIADAGKEVDEKRERARLEAEALRNVTISSDRADAARLVTLASRFSLHLSKYARAEKKDDEEARFDRVGAFFFYGAFRARKVDFYAKGSIFFPRVWLEHTFQKCGDFVVNHIAGGQDGVDGVSLKDEAVLYWHFGGTREPRLLETAQLLLSPEKKDEPESSTALRRVFERFCQRLPLNEEPPKDDRFNAQSIALAALSMDGLLAYSLASLLPHTYGLGEEDIPGDMPLEAPKPLARLFDAHQEGLCKIVWPFIAERGPKKAAP